MVCNYLGKGIRPKIQLEKFFTEARVSQVLLSFVKTRSQIVFINPTELLCWYPDWKNYELLSLSQEGKKQNKIAVYLVTHQVKRLTFPLIITTPARVESSTIRCESKRVKGGKIIVTKWHLWSSRRLGIFRISPAHCWSISIQLKFWVHHFLPWIVSTCMVIVVNESKAPVIACVLHILWQELNN